MAIADVPERQTLLIVTAGISLGIPAPTAACRDVIWPCPAWITCPMIVYSTWAGSRRHRSSAAAIAWAPRSTARSGARPPRNRPIGVRAPATMNERVTTSSVRGADAEPRVAGSEAVRERLLDDLEDLVADELVLLHQRVAERAVDVAVLHEHLAHAFALRLQDVLDPLLRLRVPEHLADEVRLRERAVGDRLVADQRTGHPERSDHLGGQRRRLREVRPRARPRLTEAHLLRGEAAERNRDHRLDLGLGPREALLLVGVRQQPERATPLDAR